jgi:hypothetical protein
MFPLHPFNLQQHHVIQNNCVSETENSSYHTILRNNKPQCMLLWCTNTHLPLWWYLTTKFSRPKCINPKSVKTKIQYLNRWEINSVPSKLLHHVHTLSIVPVSAGSTLKLSFWNYEHLLHCILFTVIYSHNSHTLCQKKFMSESWGAENK